MPKNKTESLQVEFRDYRDRDMYGHNIFGFAPWEKIPDRQTPPKRSRRENWIRETTFIGALLVAVAAGFLASGISAGAELGFYALPASCWITGVALLLQAGIERARLNYGGSRQ